MTLPYHLKRGEKSVFSFPNKIYSDNFGTPFLLQLSRMINLESHWSLAENLPGCYAIISQLIRNLLGCCEVIVMSIKLFAS